MTTQINLSDDPYLHDDFAYATRDELIAEIRFSDDQQLAREFGVQGRFAQIDFDFIVNHLNRTAGVMDIRSEIVLQKIKDRDEVLDLVLRK